MDNNDNHNSKIESDYANSASGSAHEPQALSAVAEHPQEPSDVELHEPIQFKGVGGEYFKIWAVNVVLTIITFGLYGPWAKVRTKQYFYGKTLLQNQGFRYLANPKTILKGRILALVAFGTYSMLSETIPEVALILMGLFGLAMPKILNSSLRFNAVNTSYRGVRFGFDGTYFSAFKVFLLWPLLNVFTLGLATPLIAKKSHEYILRHSRYGQTPLEFSAKTGQYYKVFAKASLVLVAGLLLGVAGGVIGALVSSGSTPEEAGGFANILTILVMYVAFFMMVSMIKLGLLEIYFNCMSVEKKRFTAQYSVKRFMVIKIQNMLLTLLTLGLFYPFAKVRMARFLAQGVIVRGTGDLDSFSAGEREKSKALGEELGEIFDLDVGFI